MKLFNTESREEFEAEIIVMEDEDFRKVKQSKQFQFDWEQESGNQVFKIVAIDETEDREILGLISFTDIPDEFRIHINLIENSNDNKGKHKKVDRIAGCLIAFAAQMSFQHGYGGFISLAPKTTLITLYIQKYGFTQYGRQLAMEGREAIDLIQKYL